LRSPTEIAFRLRQELRNGLMAVRAPRLPPRVTAPSPLCQLPDPASVAAAVRGTPFADSVLQNAEAVLAHRFPLLGLTIDTGPEIRWRRDYASGTESGVGYFRTIPYLDAARVGDHKMIWELNRHQHLVLLAQAHLLNGDDAAIAEIARELDSWFAANPFHRGINWASALEVAFRALSWIWVWHLAGSALDERTRRLLLEGIYQHGAHLANNLSHYFSPNTHLLGEAVTLHALGHLLPELPHAGHWRELGRSVVQEQMRRQVREDGSHFEQSAYYHVYALDMLLFHAVLEEPSKPYRNKLARMAEYLQSIMGPAWRLPLIGDDDGGRFFHPYGVRDEFGRATLATCGAFLNRLEWIRSTEDLYPQAVWWLGPRALDHRPATPAWRSHQFADSGIAVMSGPDTHIVADAGPFGPWGGGHSHSDTLSLIVRHGGEDILIDPGTCTYVGDRRQRDWFRGSSAHNTIRIDGRDQATAVNPFRWEEKPRVVLHEWLSSAARDRLDAECSYAGFTHRRTMEFLRGSALLILDEVRGPAGEHEIEQWWHLSAAAAASRLVLEEGAEAVESWRSLAYGEKHPAPAIRVVRRGSLPVPLAAIVLLGAQSGRIEHTDGGVNFVVDGATFTL